MGNKITIDFGKYIGTYSVNEAKEIVRKMKAEISEIKINIDVLEKKLKQEKKISEYENAVEHNKDIPYIQFEEGNEYQFGMDFGFWQNIPSDVRFYPVGIFNNNERVQFIGIGYGILEEHKEKFGLIGDYGNGFISVSASQIPHLMDEVKSKLLIAK
jgi:hypothetical protein